MWPTPDFDAIRLAFICVGGRQQLYKRSDRSAVRHSLVAAVLRVQVPGAEAEYASRGRVSQVAPLTITCLNSTFSLA